MALPIYASVEPPWQSLTRVPNAVVTGIFQGWGVMDHWFPRSARGVGLSRRVAVTIAAVGLAASGLGLLVWFLLTRNAWWLAWQTSLATILAVVLTSWGMSVAMLAWARKMRIAGSRTVQEGSDGSRGESSPSLRSLAELNPFDLEVHRPVEVNVDVQLPDLPRYLPRDHDAQLRRIAEGAAGGASGIAVMVGGSSTGKTRAAWEALDCLRGREPRWQLWHPIDPARPDAALAGLSSVGPRTVVWLNEAQLYLDTRADVGERVAARLRELLRDPVRRPVLVLATLWPAHWEKLTLAMKWIAPAFLEALACRIRLTYHAFLPCVVVFLVFFRRYISACRVKPFRVVPGDPFQGREHDIIDPAPWPFRSMSSFL
jgi:hypothetical protein